MSQISAVVTRVGEKKTSVSIPIYSQQWLKIFTKFQITENYFPDRILPKIVYTPENYKIVDKFVNSTEYFSNVIIRNDPNQSADRSKWRSDIMLTIIKAYNFLGISKSPSKISRAYKFHMTKM